MNVRFNPRILSACLVGLVIAGGSFFLAEYKKDQRELGTVNVADQAEDEVAETPVTIDVDRLVNVDWQTDLEEARRSASSTDNQPKTVTERFAVVALEEMMLSNMYEHLGARNPNDVDVSEAIIRDILVDDLYTFADLTTTKDVKTETLKVYGNRVLAITLENTIDPELPHELDILQQARTSGDPEDLAPLQEYVDYFEAVLEDTKAVTVPIIYQQEHLNLLNAYLGFLNDLKAMQLAFSDPVQHSVRLNRYQADQQAIGDAVVDLYTKMYVNGVRFDDTDIVSQVLTMSDN